MNNIIQDLEVNATNGKENFCYISEKQLNAMKELYKREAKEIENLQQENKQLKEKLDKYENPEDMTLMMMWCTEKVKDENKKLKKQLQENTETLLGRILELRGKQKEFINYLEDEIQKKRKKATTLTSFEKNVVPLKHCLQKYKEIIGDK